ncbi:hypothetical protein [Mycolicibacterium sp.]|uniref:hypothetical protein n=1 Tax=Mycolicibacterium sp. TaxID=2320850 RepID=UPI00093E1840
MPDAARAERAFPAPGSAVPGAPPALKRALTPADGVQLGGQQPPGVSAVVSAAPAAAGGARFTAAAALMGVAVGLELAGLLSRVTRARGRPKH